MLDPKQNQCKTTTFSVDPKQNQCKTIALSLDHKQNHCKTIAFSEDPKQTQLKTKVGTLCILRFVLVGSVGFGIWELGLGILNYGIKALRI